MASLVVLQNGTVPVATTNPLPVTLTSGATDQDVNLVTVAGAAIALGQAAMAASLPVAIASNQSALPVGSGTAGTAATAVVTVQGIASATPVLIARAPVATAALGIVPVVSSALETGHVIKASAGNLYALTVSTTSASGFVQIFNSTTVPAAGAVTPIDAFSIPAASTLIIGYDPPIQCGTGISVAFSTAATPFTKTDSATAYFSGKAV